MTRMLIRHALATAVAAGALFTTTANAQAYEPTHVAVRTADVDLTSAQGRSTVARRIHIAADTACGDVADKNLTIASHAMRCKATAIETAMRQLDTAVTQAKNGTQVASIGAAATVRAR